MKKASQSSSVPSAARHGTIAPPGTPGGDGAVDKPGAMNVRRGRDAPEHGGDAVVRVASQHEEAHGFGQQRREQRREDQRRHAPTEQQNAPAELWQHSGAMKPPMADPRVKPQNIMVTSDERRAAGQNSDASVIVIGMAPPSPRPVRNRQTIKDPRPPLKAEARLATPNTTIEPTSIVLRP